MKIFISSSLLVAAIVTTQTNAAFPADVTALMDTSVDPCEDFYLYSCGGWLKNFTIPADKSGFNYASEIIAKRDAVIQDILKENKPIIGDLYNSCMDRKTLTAMGNAPLRNAFANITAAQTKYDLAKVAGNLGTIGASLIVDWDVVQDPQDATTNVFFVDPASTVLSSDYYAPDQFASIEAPFRKYISTMVKLAGINVNSTSQDSKNGSTPVDTKNAEDLVISIDKQVAAIQPTDEEQQGYYTIKYSEGLSKWPLAFKGMVQGFDVLNHSALTPDSKVLLASPAFMDRAEKLFNSLALTDLKIYYKFLYVDFYGRDLGEEFVQANFEFYDKVLVGATAPDPRNSVCTDAVMALLPDVMGEYYAQKMFGASQVQDVTTMTNAIEQAMGQHIAQLPWMDEPTRKAALKKLSMVVNLIGHSVKPENYPYVLSRDNLFANVQTIQTKRYHDILALINKPVDRAAWPWRTSAASYRPYYALEQNQVVFPGGIFQSPYYTQGAHPAQKFGALGTLIGHHVTYGFDIQGQYYDGVGNVKPWWTNATTNAFNDRATCMVDQYNQFVVYGDSGKPVGHVDGSRTLTENADFNGGVSLAYDAYYSWVKSGATFNSNGVKDDEVDKLFFLSYSQLWCEKVRDEKQKQVLQTSHHPPGVASTNGVAMNSEHFAKVFQCKVGSKMNPEKKCGIW